MCHRDTKLAIIGLTVLLCAGARAQTIDTGWRRIGGLSFVILLAAPAGGAVDAAWFSSDGATLYARTASGRVFETSDFESWTPSRAARPADAPVAGAQRMPAANARLLGPASQPGRLYALADNLYRSDDGGRSWTNLTAWRGEAVIGAGQRDVAVSPRDGDSIVVANSLGLWRSLDGGMSWSGLNDSLPNLAVRRILSMGTAGVRVALEGVGAVELLPGGGREWRPSEAPDAELALRRELSQRLRADITAVASAGDTRYAGSADGRLWVSFDRGATFAELPQRAGGAIASLFADAARPATALAAVAGTASRILRTTNAGGFWDDVTGDLAAGSIHGLAAEIGDGAVYAAGDRGLFFARVDLENASPASPRWTKLAGGLPEAPAMDVKLDAAGNQLYVALDGYGLYATRAPHRARRLRIVNAADFSTRAAAPGSLLSILGGRVTGARSGDLNVPVLAATDTASQIQVPFEVTGSNLSLALEAGLASATLGVPLRPASPAIFIGSEGEPMLLDADSGLMLDARNAARSQGRIQILATGLGRVRPEWPTGLAAPLSNPPAVVARVQAFLDGVEVEVTRSVLASGYVGFYLIELQLPAIVNAGPAELYLAVDGQPSNKVRVYLEP